MNFQNINLQNILQILTPWLLSHGVKIIAILVAGWIINRIAKIFISKLIEKFVSQTYKTKDGKAQEKRTKTLEGVLGSAIGVVVWIMAGLMIVSEFGVNIGPLLAIAGVAGIAFGFGGQYLIKDLIAGLFIILEDQYRVGDVASIAGTTGLVEDINLRRTILRDLDGVVHNVPNGEISKASNLSKQFSRVNLNIGIAYDSDLEKVIRVVNRIGQELAKDPKWKEGILKAPQFLRVDDFADSAIIIKILGDTEPLKQWEVAGELRKRLKIAFDKEKIEIPFPQHVIHQAKS